MDSHNRFSYHQIHPGHRLKGSDKAIGLRSRIILTVSEFRDQVKSIKPHTSVPNCAHCHHEQQNCEINLLKSGENVRGTNGRDGKHGKS